jgi:abortive infection bacteriophage resistance protein
MELKEPKIFEEQVKLIQDKGFIVADVEEKECLEFIKRANYYRLSAYFLPFRKKDGTFFEGISFSRIQRIYEFDSRLRALIFIVI